jgi:glycosyltransferase involved in cell wall biosynthesis
MDRPTLRIVWSSNAPWCGTGYGNQTKHIVRGIRDLGYPLAIQAFYGLEGGRIEWEGIPVQGNLFDEYGNDAIPLLATTFKADLLITLIDLWVMDPALGHMGNVKWTPYFPLDAEPIAPRNLERFPHAHKLLVYSRFAEGLVRAAGYEPVYIPHGIDVDTYTVPTEEERSGYRKNLFPDWPEDAFICGMVAANKGWPARKSFAEVMEAFARFHARHENARLYLHSIPETVFRGPDLRQMAEHYGIVNEVRTANGAFTMSGEYTDAKMREIYCTFDVLLSPSQGEGFGIPIVEAQACGVPVIVQDYSAMSELVGDGWRLRPLYRTPTLIWNEMAVADPAAIEHSLEECIRRPVASRPLFRQIARRFAEGYNWPDTIKNYWAPFLESMDTPRRAWAQELVQSGGRRA